MDSSLFKFFLFAIMVQCCHSAEPAKNKSNSSTTSLQDIMKDQQARSDLEKRQKQQQPGPASYLDIAKNSASKSEAHPKDSKKRQTKGAEKEAAILKFDEATTAVPDQAEGTKKELNKGKGKVEDHKKKDTEIDLDNISHVSIQQNPDGKFQHDLIQPLDMKMENRFNEITEESLPELQITITTSSLEGTIDTGNAAQIRKKKGKGKRRGKGKNNKKPQQPKNLESCGDLVGTGSGRQNENENENEKNSEKPIILTELQFVQFRAAFEKFIENQESYLKKELEKLNQVEILRKTIDEELVSAIRKSAKRHDDNWHKAVRKVLITVMKGTHKFWRENLAQFVSKEPLGIDMFYAKMTAIYVGPIEGRSAKTKQMIPRVNNLSMLLFKASLMHNQKSVDLLMDAVNKLNEKMAKFHSELEQINNNPNLNAKKNDKIREALQPVTSYYKQNFVEEDKFKEYFHVVLLMVNKMSEYNAKLYTNLMRLADVQSEKWISPYMDMLFNNIECGDFKVKAMNADFKVETMKVFNDYFDKARLFPSALDNQEKGLARSFLTSFDIGKLK